MRVFVPGEGGAQQLFALAAAEHVQVRHLRPSVPTLEDVFAHAVGENDVRRSTSRRMPIHDQRRTEPTTTRAIALRRRADRHRLDGDRARRHPHA